ncbi:hypothetical protein EHP00_1469 [Ecytonucleospora hepatopenaei]|uniref:Dynein light chain n=1 Tax=Ecytonucleospora hepatopenaei TaxID=646526 RepID=A0A1W0E762_9MICR|nr:hypothetical protein EHP00_1469 [Ecytonucleospora hepatopenaei]
MVSNTVVLNYKTKKVREDLKVFLENEMAQFDKESIPMKSDILKTKLDETFGKGWNVWIGGHFSGACTCIANTMVEFSYGSENYIVYQSYVG